MKIRSLFIAAGLVSVAIGTSAILAMWRATQDEGVADLQQQQAQQVARDVSGLVGVTYVFQRERDELSVSEWKGWYDSLVRDLAGAKDASSSPGEVELLRDATARLPGLFQKAMTTSATPASDFERRRQEQAFELLLGDTQAMADAAFRWSRNAGETRRIAENVHSKVTIGAVATFMLMFSGLALLAVRRVLRPLARLTQATEALERGERVPLFASVSRDELGVLKRGFDAMSTALQHRTEELREAERRTRALTNSIPVLVTEFDKDARIVFANTTVAHVYGVTPDALIGKTVGDVRGKDGEVQLLPRIQAVFSGQSTEFDSTQEIDGTLRHFHQLYVPRRSDDGTVIGFYSVSVDITDRKAGELALQTSEQRLADILRQSPDAFVCTDADGRITDWNPAAETMFGWTRDEVKARPLAEVLIPEEHREAHNTGMNAFRTSGRGAIIGKRLELPTLHRNGSVIPAELSIGALRDGDGYAAFAFVRDIRERLAVQEEVKKSQSRLQQVLGNIPALVGYFDRDIRCRYANGLARKLQNIAPGQEIGLPLQEAVGPEIYELHRPFLPQVLAGQPAQFEGSIQLKGKVVHFQVHLVPEKEPGGEVSGFYVMTFDITAMKEARLEQERARRQLRAITDNLPVMISYIDAQHRLQFLNRTFEEWTGVSISSAIGKPLRDVLGELLYEQRRAPLERALQGQRVEFEVVSEALGVRRILHTAYIPDCPSADVTVGVYTLTSDVTALREAEQRMAQLALTDPLTGLANRRHFEKTLPQALARAARAKTGTALMFLDIDHFKRINDTFGHAAGDAVLLAFSQRLAACVRSTDAVARLAGDEFVVVLEGMKSPEECHVIAHKVNAAARAPLLHADEDLAVTTSIGLAYLRAGLQCDAEVLLRHADEALYRTKDEGRDGYTTVEIGAPEARFSTSSFADL